MFGEKNSAAEIFKTVSMGKRYSRAELSKLTGYSLMTVGKVIDSLEKGGLVVQEKHSSGSVGRNMNLCTVRDGCGMLIYDFSKSNPHIYVFDMRLGVKGEFLSESEDFASIMAEGFGCFLEFSGGDLMGIGCIVNEGSEEEYCEKIRQSMAPHPELVISPKYASAAAHINEAKPQGLSLFVRTDSGVTDLVLWNYGFVRGSHNRAADGAFINGSDELAKVIASFCMIADPEAVYISANDGEAVCKSILAILMKNGVPSDSLPRLISKADSSERTVPIGAATMLRQKIVAEIAAKNS